MFPGELRPLWATLLYVYRAAFSCILTSCLSDVLRLGTLACGYPKEYLSGSTETCPLSRQALFLCPLCGFSSSAVPRTAAFLLRKQVFSRHFVMDENVLHFLFSELAHLPFSSFISQVSLD